MELIIGGGILATCLVIMGLNLSANNKFREEAERKYVNKDVCDIVRVNTAEKLEVMDKKLDKLLQKNGIK